MNASTLFDLFGSTQSYTGFSQRRGNAFGAFSDKLSSTQARQYTHTYIQGDPVTLKMGKNVLCSGEHYGQSYTAEYTPDSTDEDPIARISGTASGGDFDFTRHIRDIDPSNASYAELCALYTYLCRTGEYQPDQKNMSGALPAGMACGDISRKQNFTQNLENFIASASQSGVYPKFGPSTYAYARKLLDLYRNLDISGSKHPAAQISMYSKVQNSSNKTESAFGKYLDVDEQRRKMRELPPEQGLGSVYMQFMEDYRNWKAGQPELSLPDSEGWTDEILEFLRDHYSGDLSAFEIYDALETMQKLGMLSQKAMNCATGSQWIAIDASNLKGFISTGADPDSTAFWLHGFDEAPMVDFHSLDDILAWAEEFHEEDHPDFITYAEALARGWI